MGRLVFLKRYFKKIGFVRKIDHENTVAISRIQNEILLFICQAIFGPVVVAES